jgi:hypothetical protein
MEHLKPYKIFESSLMLDTNILGDILQEITDLGYLSYVESLWWSDDRGNSIRITIYGKDEFDKKFNCNVAYIYPDEVIEVMERLVEFLSSENYSLEEGSRKSIDVIKNRPTDKTKDEIEVPTSKLSQVTMRWDDKIRGYKVCYSQSLDFRQ